MKALAALAVLALAVLSGASPVGAQTSDRESVFARPPLADDGPLDASAWRRVDTPHFALIGDVPGPTLRALAADLEALESLLGALNPADTQPAPPRAAVIVFARDSTFARYAPPAENGEPAQVSGFFLSHPHGDFVAVSAEDRDVASVLYHEAIHRFLRHHLPEAPLWLNEGLAEFYSTLEVGRGEAWVGRPVVEHVVRLQSEPRRPLAELLEIDTASHVYQDGGANGAFYAESWALVHWLLAGEGSDRGAVAEYAGLLRAGEDPGAAFAAALGSPAVLERAIDAHVHRAPREPAHAELPRTARPADLRVATLTEAELDYRLGWLAAHHSPQRQPLARSHFEAALRAEPGHAGALTGVGWLAELDGDLDAARQHYARAAELDPRDPLPPFLEAQSLLKLATTLPEEDLAAAPGQGLLKRARDGFRRSLELEPELAEAWAGLGAAWVADRSPQPEGLDALRKAYRRLPMRDDVLYNLTVLEASLGSRERAAALFTRLERRADPEWVERARESLQPAEPTSAQRTDD